MFTTTKNAETSFLRPCVRFWYWSVSLNVWDNWKSWIIIWDILNAWRSIRWWYLFFDLWRDYTEVLPNFGSNLTSKLLWIFAFYLLFDTENIFVWTLQNFYATVNLSSLINSNSQHTHPNNMDDRFIKQGTQLRFRITIDSKIFYAY